MLFRSSSDKEKTSSSSNSSSKPNKKNDVQPTTQDKYKTDPVPSAGKLITERELLFRTGDGYVVPEFRTYEDVRRFWSYPNRAKLEVKRKMIYDVKEV